VVISGDRLFDEESDANVQEEKVNDSTLLEKSAIVFLRRVPSFSFSSSTLASLSSSKNHIL
jgi:hypothetical protein